MKKPLVGVLVLDLSRVLAGPWATQTLADLGARVIKIEHPVRGDDTRHWGPPHLENNRVSESAYYLSANRGKESVAIDIKDPRGQALILKLARRADILVENFRVGALAKYGLDYESVKTLNPAIVYCSITGFGQSGPRAAMPGYDFIIQAMSGLMSITGEDKAVRTGVAVSDLFSGLYATIGILGAYTRAKDTGAGTHVDISLLDSQLAGLANQALNFLVSGQAPGLQGNTHPNIVPYQVFAALDQPIVLAVGNDRQFASLCTLLKHPEWAQDERFATNPQRVHHRDMMVAMISEELVRQPAAHWLSRFAHSGIPAAPVNTIAQALADEQVKHREVVEHLERQDLGDVPTMRSPIRFKDEDILSRRAPPAKGDSTELVLTELGLSAAEINELISDKIVVRN